MNDIDNYYTNLGMCVNIDEAGQDEYVYTHSMKAIVDTKYTKSSIKTPVMMNTKRSTLVHCICSDRTYAKPLVIILEKQWILFY